MAIAIKTVECVMEIPVLGGIKEDVAKRLAERYGELIGGDDLRLVLGFPTLAALKQAIRRSTLSLPTFLIPGRRGRFATTSDIVEWLIDIRNEGMARDKEHAAQAEPRQ